MNSVKLRNTVVTISRELLNPFQYAQPIHQKLGQDAMS